MTPSETLRHLPWLDGWRGIAIALVLFEHLGGAATGRLGVEIFFVLSGLLISRILFEQRVPLGLFYRRRAARILPVFYLYVGVMTFAGLIVLPSIDWASVGTTAIFLRSYFGSHIWADPLAFGNLWSLNVEEHAYLFLSLLALIASKRSERAARWLLTLSLAIPLSAHVFFRLFPDPGATPFQLRTEGAIFPLLASAAVFMWSRAYRIEISTRVAVAILATTCFVAVIDAIGVDRGGTAIKALVLPLLLALSVNVLHRMPSMIRELLSTRWLMWLGTCSYSLYLWHYPFFVLINRGLWPYGKLAALICALAIGAASFYFFERPMRALLRGSESTARSAAPAPAV